MASQRRPVFSLRNKFFDIRKIFGSAFFQIVFPESTASIEAIRRSFKTSQSGEYVKKNYSDL